ncbi:hypothetical protein J7E24_06320 [Hymenobacter sp. ISL-91]|uniref:hypothetical protein n=1 Tax=Hymenobacter sp. ISL-91 TaxID=2819151 RepID=UPI001BEC0E40|nr:hypothetical protein [Hymenobacter sp. ISL-91]MBT2557393.1 hypothetical protein [Hymenobacter sp. ISL-91]
MPVWICTVHAKNNLLDGPFKNYKGVIVNAFTYSENKEIAIENITQELSKYFLKVISIDDLEIFHKNKFFQIKRLRKLAANSQKHFTTEFDIFYTYEE